MAANEPSTQPHPGPRVFLVVVDETEEMRNALRYACRRAQHTNGRVALLLVTEPAEFQHWLGVGRVIEEETRLLAEQRLQTLAAEVFEQTGRICVLHLREGAPTSWPSSCRRTRPSRYWCWRPRAVPAIRDPWSPSFWAILAAGYASR